MRGLIVDDFDHGAIYLATLPTIYRSVDQGATWTALTAGQTPSNFKSVNVMASDGPGVLYVGWSPGFETFTVAPDMEILTTPPAAGAYRTRHHAAVEHHRAQQRSVFGDVRASFVAGAGERLLAQRDDESRQLYGELRETRSTATWASCNPARLRSSASVCAATPEVA